jgi:aryl-alcohol dehydrogenase-like predicted oxidoreductase
MDRVLKDYAGKDDLHHVIKVVVPDRGDGRIFSPDKFRLQVEEALRELHTERISIVQWLFLDTDAEQDEQVFLPELPSIIEQVKTTFEDLKSAGKVGHLYAMARTPKLLDGMLSTNIFEGAVERYNLLNMRMAEKFDYMKEKKLGLIPIEPLRAGLLTDKRQNRSMLPKDDRFCDSKFDADYSKLSRITEVLKNEIGDSLTAFSLRFHFATPIIPCVAVSLNTVEQVDEICDAIEAPFPAESTIEKALEIWKSG